MTAKGVRLSLASDRCLRACLKNVEDLSGNLVDVSTRLTYWNNRVCRLNKCAGYRNFAIRTNATRFCGSVPPTKIFPPASASFVLCRHRQDGTTSTVMHRSEPKREVVPQVKIVFTYKRAMEGPARIRPKSERPLFVCIIILLGLFFVTSTEGNPTVANAISVDSVTSNLNPHPFHH